MLPPLDEETLRNNPAFANLYSSLTQTFLHPDGSTRHDEEAEERAAVEQELDKWRFSTAKDRLIEHALFTAHLQQRSSLPEPLLELLLLLPPLLAHEQPLASESTDMLLSSRPLSDWETLLPDVASLTSSSLHSTALNLARVFHPTTNASYLHRQIPRLPEHYTTIRTDLVAAKRSLVKSRMRILAALGRLLGCYSQSLVHLVRSLEAKHGVVARSLELRASDVCLRAQRTDVEASGAVHEINRDLYPPQAIDALHNYAECLKDSKLRVADRVRQLRADLGEYGVGVAGCEDKEKMFTEMAVVYRDLSGQIADVKSRLECLQSPAGPS
ncbi:hypothetical protein L249_6054 [Ophiocordyceps polyrhachis-furcata BCC 54312]|uniref:HAUS augmin-like complex subunit 4 n=1 Tax=Ophiocordyceps polyrhachis-furcata BCC 54312 TaxID=1330021 RepID=A0A367LIQ8_9HYPO|nr:hypothetical protein L249_6054 [Ophiocordyceps polyrhachis-furcata BCC 54312]